MQIESIIAINTRREIMAPADFPLIPGESMSSVGFSYRKTVRSVAMILRLRKMDDIVLAMRKGEIY